MEISQGDPEIYLTLFLGVLDIRRLTFDYSSAGIHVPPIILSGGKALELFQQSDFPIGHVASHEYETFHRAFLPGDVFVFVSDGVIEAQRGHAVFGRQKLMEEIENVHRSTGSVDVDSIVGSVRTFLEGEPPQDDMCVLTISFDAPADPVR
jgi:serine phosphatase RsbU (regulator of sigma subunit)